jgi:signal transduction histidine kinase
MRKVSVLVLVIFSVVCFVGFVQAAVDKDAIKKQVDEIVAAMDGGKTAADFKDAAKKEPYYVFFMQEDGKLLVHPSLEGQNLKEKAAPVFDAVAKATAAGVWVDYEWQCKMKHTYVRKTKGALIVGSGYSD